MVLPAAKTVIVPRPTRGAPEPSLHHAPMGRKKAVEKTLHRNTPMR